MFEISDFFTMFLSSFTLVFLLGFQSKNVQNSKYFAAICTSFGISVANFLFVKYAAAGNLTAFSVCALGGCLGIASSIWVGDKTHRNAPQSICKCPARAMPTAGGESPAQATPR